MRCLYCGKELALLKRWTGGGEFCTDAHRQRYQEEYNQLALNRLLQAKAPNEATSASEGRGASIKVAEPKAASPAAALTITEGTRNAPAAWALAPVPEPLDPPQKQEPEVLESVPPPRNEPEPVVEPEIVAPAEIAGYLVEMPISLVAEISPVSHPDMEFLAAVAAALPNHTFEPLRAREGPYQLETAGLVAFRPSNQASNYTAKEFRERRLEVRDFVRTNPVVEIDLAPAGETGLESSGEAMDILIFPQPPQALSTLWQEPPAGFVTGGTELGSLARLVFETTGFSGQEESGEREQSPAPAAAVALALAEPPEIERPVETNFLGFEKTLPEPVVENWFFPQPVIAPEPEPPLAASVEQIAEQVSEASFAADQQAAAPVADEVVEQEPPVPEAAARPLPLVLHVVPPGKAKTTQVFSSVASAAEAQIPRSTSLPLRPTMVFGPAPVKEVKAEPKKTVSPAPVRPDPKIATGSTSPKKPVVAKIAEPVPEPVKEAAPIKQVAKAAAPVAPKPSAKVDPIPVKRGSTRSKDDSRLLKLGDPLPTPLAAPYPGSSDLGLPLLNLQASQGPWGRLPVLAKIAIAVVLVGGIGTLIAFSSKSGGTAVATPGAGTIVAGTALPAGDAGWITDWGAEPGVRRTRQVSILRSSQTLTDYRIEMEAQIDTKAIGWIFRAQDPKNFYVSKLEIVKPGLEPTVALVHFAVINGEEQAHAQLPLSRKVRRDTMYKIRFDAVGNHFTTYVQDEKADDWTDDRVKTGGVGMYSERGEQATLKGGLSVVPLVIRK